MLRSIGSVTGLALLMVACGGGGGGGSAPTPAFTVGGTVSGLVGTGLVLRDNGGDDLPVAADGAIAFSTRIADGAAYSVTVFTPPTSPAQTCTVTHGNGTIVSANATNVAVSCTTNRFTGFVNGAYFYTETSSTGAAAGPVLFEGAGGYSGTYVLNDSGFISSGSLSGTYTAAVGGAMALDDYSGAVSGDGTMIVSADLQVDHAPSVNVQIKQGQTNFTNADFTGIYQLVSITSSTNSGSSLTLSADGAGHYSGTQVQNNAGVITSGTVSGAYSVAADGALIVTPASGSPLSGGISADGKNLVLSQLTAGQPSELAVGTKQGQDNFTNADVAGSYDIVNYTTLGNVPPESYSAELAALTFDGAGNISGTVTRNALGGGISNASVTGTYEVAADGTLTVQLLYHYGRPVSVALTGGVSSDGNTLVLTKLQVGLSAASSVGLRL
jgi:hypothetical protein